MRVYGFQSASLVLLIFPCGLTRAADEMLNGITSVDILREICRGQLAGFNSCHSMTKDLSSISGRTTV
jgi:hypothetical protein